MKESSSLSLIGAIEARGVTDPHFKEGMVISAAPPLRVVPVFNAPDDLNPKHEEVAHQFFYPRTGEVTSHSTIGRLGVQRKRRFLLDSCLPVEYAMALDQKWCGLEEGIPDEVLEVSRPPRTDHERKEADFGWRINNFRMPFLQELPANSLALVACRRCMDQQSSPGLPAH